MKSNYLIHVFCSCNESSLTRVLFTETTIWLSGRLRSCKDEYKWVKICFSKIFDNLGRGRIWVYSLSICPAPNPNREGSVLLRSIYQRTCPSPGSRTWTATQGLSCWEQMFSTIKDQGDHSVQHTWRETSQDECCSWAFLRGHFLLWKIQDEPRQSNKWCYSCTTNCTMHDHGEDIGAESCIYRFMSCKWSVYTGAEVEKDCYDRAEDDDEPSGVWGKRTYHSGFTPGWEWRLFRSTPKEHKHDNTLSVLTKRKRWQPITSAVPGVLRSSIKEPVVHLLLG